MRVARLHDAGDLRIEDAERPAPGPGEELVRVTAVGLCGSDLHWYDEGGIGDTRVTDPLVLGHEFAGVIEGGPRDGERVAVDPQIPCRTCAPCEEGHPNLCLRVEFAGSGTFDGALREYVVWPSRNCYRLPDELSAVDGAMLEPLGIAVHAIDLCHVPLGGTVGVFGGGPIGLLVAQAARAAGAGHVVVTDPLPHRRTAAAELGADVTADPADRDAIDRLDGALDVVYEAAGTDEALADAVTAARPGARVAVIGIPEGHATTFPASTVRRKGLSLLAVRRMKDPYVRTIRLVRSGRVDVAAVASATYPLAETAPAFEAAVRREGLKIVVTPTDG